MYANVRKEITGKWRKNGPDDSHLVAWNCWDFCFRAHWMRSCEYEFVHKRVDIHSIYQIRYVTLSLARCAFNIWYYQCAMSIIIIIHSADWLHCIHFIMLSTDNKLLIRIYIIHKHTYSYSTQHTVYSIPICNLRSIKVYTLDCVLVLLFNNLRISYLFQPFFHSLSSLNISSFMPFLF